MKLHFESNLEYQIRAVHAVCDLFRGQESYPPEFAVPTSSFARPRFASLLDSNVGRANQLRLSQDEILRNLNDVQLRNGMLPSLALESMDFTVEMETGTGKTYVYLRTIFELYQRFGFTKFIIVVPSIAIKEGVYKTLQITEEHFRDLYANPPFEYYLYDSTKLGRVKRFATSEPIQIMIVSVGAINKKEVNNLYKETEKMGGETPIHLIQQTHPILIVDEPQSVDGGLSGRGKEALRAMHPLCTLRYSATHVNVHHMVYRLDAVDAYEKKLVKQIEVASATVEGAYNRPFVRFIRADSKGTGVRARVLLDVDLGKGVQRSEMEVRDGDDLEEITGRALYNGCRIGEIRAKEETQFMELCVPGAEYYLRPGEALGDVDEFALARQMIGRTIREHLDKQKRLWPLGIKVLSLFFVDSVDKYRKYDDDGDPIKGEYALIFEEEYERLADNPEYRGFLREMNAGFSCEQVHGGYFSIDKRGGWSDTSLNNQANRDNAERAYHLIMQDKEQLLSFATPLSFLFSHSALREGWDNPNVFQICSLRDIKTQRERRQTIGRGLRLAVNQRGERVRDVSVNTLTVVATEGYEAFAQNLQKEIERDTGIRFGMLEPHQFAAIVVQQEDGLLAPLGMEQSAAIWRYLEQHGYVSHTGKVKDKLKRALTNDTLELPSECDAYRTQIFDVLQKTSDGLVIKNADDGKGVATKEPISDGTESSAAWEPMNHGMMGPVEFDNEWLVTECIRQLRQAPPVAGSRIEWKKADIAMRKSGIAAEPSSRPFTAELDDANLYLPDVLTDLQNRTNLTKRTIVRILIGSERLDDFKSNPQTFIELTATIINRCLRSTLKHRVTMSSK